MDELIKEITSIPGVEGICSFASSGEILECSLDSPEKEKMINASKMVIRLLLSGTTQVGPVSSLSICYEHSIINARKTKTGLYLVIRHSKDTDANLINVTIDNSILLQIQSDSSQTPKTVSEDKPVEQQVNTGERQTESVIRNESKLDHVNDLLSATLAALQRAYVKLEGPASQKVFKNVLIEWSSNHPPQLASINKLLEMLSKELNDQEKIGRYKKMVLPYLAKIRGN